MKAYYFNPQTGETRVVDDVIDVPPSGWTYAGAVAQPSAVPMIPLENAGDDAIPTYRVTVEEIIWFPLFAALLVLLLFMFVGAR